MGVRTFSFSLLLVEYTTPLWCSTITLQVLCFGFDPMVLLSFLKIWLQRFKNVWHLLACRTIYEKLASAFTEEQAVLYNQRVEEISPNIRYCAYNIGEQLCAVLQ